jgi:hypothetical protein
MGSAPSGHHPAAVGLKHLAGKVVEGERDCATETAAGTGDQSYATVQSSHASILMIVFAA